MIDDVLDSTPEREEPAAGSPAAAIGRATLGSRLSATLPAGLVGRLVRAVYPRLEPELGRLPEYVPAGGTAVDVGGWFTDVRFMKLDVEGHELNALLGAGETIARDRPTLLVEVEERHGQMPDVIALMRSWSYTGHVLLDSGWTPLADFDLTAHQRDTVHELNRGFVSRMLRPGRRYINSVLFTSGPRPPSPTTHG